MATVPDTHDFTDGVATSSEANSYIRDPIRFLQKPPIAKLTATAAQNHTSTGNWQALTWGAEIVDSDVDNVGGHDNSTNPSRYTARYAGWYLVAASVVWASNTTGRRGLKFVVNGTPVLSGSVFWAATIAASIEIPSKTDLVYLNVGDYVETHAFQDSGGNLSMNGTASETNGGMTVVWVSN